MYILHQSHSSHKLLNTCIVFKVLFYMSKYVVACTGMLLFTVLCNVDWKHCKMIVMYMTDLSKCFSLNTLNQLVYCVQLVIVKYEEQRTVELYICVACNLLENIYWFHIFSIFNITCVLVESFHHFIRDHTNMSFVI